MLDTEHRVQIAAALIDAVVELFAQAFAFLGALWDARAWQSIISGLPAIAEPGFAALGAAPSCPVAADDLPARLSGGDD